MTVRLAVLGDSIAFGQGAARASDTLASRLTSGLTGYGVEVDARVLAVPGARSAGLRAQVDRALAWAPHVAVIVIGANDLTHQVPAEQAARELGDAVRRLRAGDSEVVVAPAPDLSMVPHVPAILRPVVQTASVLMRRQQVAVTLAEGGRIADPDERTARAFGSDPTLFSGDLFHPSSAGYAVIADALLPAVLAAVPR